MTVGELGRTLRRGQLSCVELTERTLAGLTAHDCFDSVITSMAGEALALARGLDRELAVGIDRGPFHGIPIAHKDNFDTAGVRTTAGSLIFRDRVPSKDAAVVTRFRAAGAVCVAKTNMHELAFGITSKNPHYGSVRNPRDTERIAGGSSGGSAALVAADLIPVATGSDTGGSIRVPASFCGIAGLKPTYGLVSRRGLVPLSFSLDCAGPLAQSVADCALALQVMADVSLPSKERWDGLRVGIPRSTFYRRLEPNVAEAVKQAITRVAQLGAEVFEVQLPDLDEINTVSRIVQMAETAALYLHYQEASQFGADVWGLIQQGKKIAAHEYVNAQRLRGLYRKEFNRLWKTADFLLAPTTPITAPLLTEDSVQIGAERVDVRLASTSLVRSWNLTGEPALSVPCGEISKRTPGHLPVGLQVIGKPFSEARLLQFGQALELAFQG